jgi:transforming growth factor-beta-induced protein
MKRILLLISFAVLTLGLTACPAETPAPGKIPAVATGNKDLSILVEALTKANLVTALDGDGPFTVFAPTDAAFAALLTELGITKEQLLARADLADILKYHVVSGSSKAASLTNGQELTTLQGGKITVAVAGGKVSLNSGRANVTTPDVAAANGVVHVIDKVLLPPPPLKTIAEVAVGNPDFSILVEALTKAGLVDTFKGTNKYTVFAPTNAAFSALLTELGVTKDQLLALPNLGDILKYHVVSGEAKAASLTDGQEVTTLQGGKVKVAVSADKKVSLNNGRANVTTADVAASNGVIHIIDKVLLLPAPVSVEVSLSGAQEVPALSNPGSSGSATVTLDGNTLTVDGRYSGFTIPSNPGDPTAHIHGPAAAGVNAGVLFPLTFDNAAGTFAGNVVLNEQQKGYFNDGLLYINLHSQANRGGEIRGQIVPPTQ